MTASTKTAGRVRFARRAATAVALVSTGSLLAACAGAGSGAQNEAAPAGEVSSENPFGVGQDGTAEAVIFEGGLGTEYFDYAVDIFTENHGGKVKVTPAVEIAQLMQPRFMGGNPPDLVDNSGADLLPMTSIIDQVEDLSDVLEAENLEGETIEDTLYPGVVESTTFDGKVAGLNYVMGVYASWYSKSLFEEHGWEPPTTWDEALELGAEAKEEGKYLYTWGKEAANYYLSLVLDSAIKEGGDDVRIALENLEPDSWSQPEVVAAFEGLKAVVDAGYVKPGGAGTSFTAAQAQWSLKQEALFYPSGSWIENEMKDQTAEGFEMVGAPAPAVSDDPELGVDAVRASASETFLVPSAARNVPAGKELLRTLLSEDAATNFAETTNALPVVKGAVPEDADFGSTGLQSQSEMLDEAGENVFNYRFLSIYGFGEPANVAFNSFLSGDMSVDEMISTLQDFSDQVREDDSIEKVEVQ